MDNTEVEDNEFTSVVDTLVNMFGNVLNKDVITAVVENCAGDLNLSAEAIMNMTDCNLYQNTDSDIGLINKTADEIDTSPTMDLISFANNDKDNINLYKVDTNESTRKECVPSQVNISSVTSLTEPTKNDDSIISKNVTSELNKKSTLNVEASVYIPRSKEGININTDINPITNSIDRPVINFETPSTSGTKHKDESQPDKAENNTFQSLISYSDFTRKTGALPKTTVKSVKSESESKLSPQLQHITEYHSQGFRILILMRGAPGSGKTHLSRQVIDFTVGESFKNYKSHVFSTDDFFSLRGPYEFNKYYLRDAHAWNQQKARIAMERGLSPVIIDNTNIEIWEMEPYLRDGVRNGYKIEVMEPKTPWARKPHQLVKKNKHGVPLLNIVRMLENYAENITGDSLISYYKLTYPDYMSPPVLRKHPPLVSSILNNEQLVSKDVQMATTNKQISPEKEVIFNDRTSNTHDTVNFTTETEKKHSKLHVEDGKKADYYLSLSQSTTSTDTKSDFHESLLGKNSDDDVDTNRSKKLICYSNIQKQLEELDRLDREWESNPPWDDNTHNVNSSKNTVTTEPKPPRKLSPTRSECDEKFLFTSTKSPNWADISMFMQPWSDGIQTMEKEDTDIYNSQKIYKVISASPRDINLHHISPYREKIPEKRMLDKSSMTNDRLITDLTRCKNEERHFIAFRKMFKAISRSGLRDIFDQCRGDVNWAVEIVLDGISNNQLQFTDDLDFSDVDEEENPEQCTCLAAYDIVPNMEVNCENENSDDIPDAITDNVHSYKKPKKEVPLSEMSIELKRQIEQNVVISDNHYSQHCLKIRKLRRGETTNEKEENNIEDDENENNMLVPFRADQDSSTADHSDEESSASGEELEKIVSMNVGHEFIKCLDDMFGRNGMTYPENVVPKLSIPVSLVNELNALWMESLMHQLDDYDKQSAEMVKQDEEFARRLAAKEMEMAEAGKEPEVPDFKEIMDMDFALSLYQKDVEEWRNKEPETLAAKLTRDKLFNLFPELPQETLSELLVAHDNNFKSTVEVLLMSTGKSDVLEEKNGLVKFVMDRELKRQEKIMEEEKKALSEVEWPLLPKGEQANMSKVNDFRKCAGIHLIQRNKSYDKAQEYFNRGMTQVALYYSDVASFHKHMFDQANSLAASTLIQVHAQKSPNNATIDLHFLRVAEALESLDLFLDTHISKLRELLAMNKGPRHHMLFFITGRGLHSNGGPRVKPAVKRRLRERGLTCRERNPGLLCARVTADDKLSHQLQN